MIYGEYIFKATSQVDDREATARGWEEVVRCKDCKYGQKRKAPYMFCDIFGAVTETEWFCSRADRKEE